MDKSLHKLVKCFILVLYGALGLYLYKNNLETLAVINQSSLETEIAIHNLNINSKIYILLFAIGGIILIGKICFSQRKHYKNLLERQEENRHLLLLKSDVYLKFQTAARNPKCILTEEDWIDLENTLRLHHIHFFQSLSAFSSMSKFEQRVCLLLKLHFPSSEIAALTNHTKQAISQVRKRLYKKHFGTEGSPGDWDKFIKSI